jgi:NhaP-type Na+/H+ or K+/H+ antiporter
LGTPPVALCVTDRPAIAGCKNGPVTAETSLIFVLAAVAAIVLVRLVADRTGLPAAALLTIAGLAYALLPGPNVTLNPALVLTFVLPPLLYSAALDSSLLAIRRNLRTVVSLSVVLVLLTALLIGIGFNLFVAGATLAVGMAVGAAVAPPDPVAALAVGRRTGLPLNLVTLIQGEGLLGSSCSPAPAACSWVPWSPACACSRPWAGTR